METQFEVGRWYYADSYYGKFKEFKHNLFYCDESINSNYKYIFHIGGHFSEDWAKFCVLVDNSKVEQFLPDGHVDKFTTKLEYVKCIRAEHLEYEVGKIYKVEDDRRVRNKNGYLPHDSLNENLKDFYVSYDFTPSTKEEFDKQNQQEWIPQVGDWVVLQESKDNWVTEMNELVGKCVQITDIDKTHKTSIKFKERDGYSWCLEDKHFRKALPHEIPDNFVLPEKWCIRSPLPKEVVDFVNMSCKYDYTNYAREYNPHFKGLNFDNGHKHIEKDYTEITLEQFKKYVLKEDSDVDKAIKILDTTGCMMYDTTEENVHWLNGRYLKVINDTTISHYPCRKGDYLKFVFIKDGMEFWGAYTSAYIRDGTDNSRYFGIKAHKMSCFELMPKGFNPESGGEVIVPFDSLWKQPSKKSPTTSSDIHIPELIRHNKTQVKVVTDLSYPKITINIISKESKKVNPVTIKQTKISLK